MLLTVFKHIVCRSACWVFALVLLRCYLSAYKHYNNDYAVRNCVMSPMLWSILYSNDLTQTCHVTRLLLRCGEHKPRSSTPKMRTQLWRLSAAKSVNSTVGSPSAWLVALLCTSTPTFPKPINSALGTMASRPTPNSLPSQQSSKVIVTLQIVVIFLEGHSNIMNIIMVSYLPTWY